jgi:mRNA interferase MazF
MGAVVLTGEPGLRLGACLPDLQATFPKEKAVHGLLTRGQHIRRLVRRRQQLNLDFIRARIDSSKPCGGNEGTLDFLGVQCHRKIRLANVSASAAAAHNRTTRRRLQTPVLVDLGMAAKVRPAVVMSIPAADVDRAPVTLVPHTTSARDSRFEAAVSVAFLRAGVFDAQNLVTIPHAKLIRSLGKLSPAQLAAVERAMAVWLGLSLAAT